MEIDLGLGDYQVLKEEAILNHLHLTCLAHLVLTHHTLGGVGAQATCAHHQVRLPTMNQRLENLRADIRREQIQRLFRAGGKHARLPKKLQRYLQAA